MTSRSDRLNAALAYAERGWPVLPCRGKLPATTHGCKDATTDKNTIRHWWQSAYVGHNIGVACGKTAGFFALDIDPKSGGDASLATLEEAHGALPETVTQFTGGGGRHLLFKANGEDIRNRVGHLGPGLDIRSDGGYIVADPSCHPETKLPYAWDVDYHPELCEIAEAPEWLLKALATKERIPEPSEGFSTPYGTAALTSECAKVAAAPIGGQEATLNSAAFSIGQLITSGDLAEGAARKALVDAGLRMTCDPARDPWTPESIAAKVEHGLADGGTKPRCEPTPAPKAPSPEAPVAAQQLSSICVLDLLKRDIKPTEMILAPWLRERDLSMIHAFRGIGKTYLSLSIALAVASGGELMKWKAPRPRKVLLVDGEMPLGALQERSRDLISANRWDCEPGAFRIVSSDAQEGFIPNLSDAKGQAAIEAHLDGVDLLVIDNLSTLAHGGPENDADSWSAMQKWLIDLRKAGKAVLLVHHSGKTGQQRGTSRREDALNVVLGLKRPEEYEEAEGARFEIHFEKARDVCGDDVRTIEAQLHGGDGSAMWTWSAIEDLRAERVAELLSQGLSQREIADELKISKSTVNRVLKRMENQ